ncbi:hypothetical protein GQ457_03G037800 [Hibiscus cannabinus]
MRQEQVVEGALPAKHHEVGKHKKKTDRKALVTSAANSANYHTRGKGRNSKKNYPPCQHCGKIGHPPFKCWKRPDAKCSKCNQLGHEAVICRSNLQKLEEVHIADQDEEDRMFVATCLLTKSSSESWLIDSGCTNHMTPDKTLFKDLKLSKVTKVRIGNGDYISVKGSGTVAVTTSSGTKTISDVLYVPEIDQNLLSVGQLLEKGFKVTFEDFYCLIYDATGKETLRVKMRGKSFSYDPTEEEQIAFFNKACTTEIWHKRLGHCHLQRILKMKKTDMIRGMPELDNHLPNCVACHFGKQNRLSFPNSTWRASQKLHLIHSDVAGPQRTPSLQVRSGWVFWKFKKMVENQSDYKIQALRSDNGREYTSTKFDLFCEEAGIEHQLTVPYTPEQNGVSERRNRSIMEMDRCMLHEKELPKTFWAKAANTAVFLQNRLPTKALKDKTPFEAWYGYKPSLSFLKVFGCMCFTHVPQVKRDKLDKKAIPGIFVGYSSVSKAYKVYHPQTGKMTISRDVQFNKDEKWNWMILQKKDMSQKPKDVFFETTDDWLNELEDDPSVRGSGIFSWSSKKQEIVAQSTAETEFIAATAAANQTLWLKKMMRDLHMEQENSTEFFVDN